MEYKVAPCRLALVLAVVAFSWPGAARAQRPSPDEVAKCRSITDPADQFACFNRLNKELKRAAKQSSSPTAVPALPSPEPSATVPAPAPAPKVVTPAEEVPACANLANPQKRLSCYDSKWPPPVAPTPSLPMNN
jgi:hypothetical protein